jgi:DNA-binding LytR/AlgR family response regulator
MHSIWLIEDEPPALRRLQKLVRELRPQARITQTFDTVADTVAAIRSESLPDLILSDIHLADGLSFRIWEQVDCPRPVIFTTAYDQYTLRAFRVNSVDYLLKPVEAEALELAFAKYEAHWGREAAPAAAPVLPDLSALRELLQQREPVYRERFLVQRGSQWLTLRSSELRQIYSEDGLTIALDADGNRYPLSETLDRLTEELPPRQWFRINRAQLVHIESVQKVHVYSNHRLQLELQPAGPGEGIVSRQRVRGCRAWLGE